MRIFLALAILFLPSFAWAGCLDTLTGPLKDVTGTTYQENDWFNVENGTRFDARGDTFTAQTLIPDSTKSKYPVDIRSSGADACWEGGAVVFTDDLNATWKQRHDLNSAGILGYDTNLQVEGVRVHNALDSFRPFWTRDSATVDWSISGSWVSYNRDDCIEADWPANGIVRDNLFDGCYVFFSATWGDTPKKTFTIEGNVVRLQKMPGPNGFNDPTKMGHGNLFKLWNSSGSSGSSGPHFILKNNVFLIEGYSATSWNIDGQADNSANTLAFKNLDECSGNTIVWIPPSPGVPFPVDISKYPAGCVTVTTDVSVYDKAKEKWISEHPNVMRLAGDPAPEPGLTQQMKDAVAAVVPAADAAVNENNLALDAAQKAVAAAQAALDLARKALTAAQNAQAATDAADTKARDADCAVNGTC